jgi:hypothetical protein
MFIKHIVTRIAAAGLLTAAGALAIGADQLSALAGSLEGAVEDEVRDESINTDADETDAAARAEGEGYPLGRAGAGESPSVI